MKSKPRTVAYQPNARRRTAVFFALAVLLHMLFSIPGDLNTDLHASEGSLLSTIPSETRSELSVVLLADTSGSMLGNDPDNLRYSALSAFIDMLEGNDYLSLITFDTDSEVVWPLTELGSAEDRVPLKERIEDALTPEGLLWVTLNRRNSGSCWGGQTARPTTLFPIHQENSRSTLHGSQSRLRIRFTPVGSRSGVRKKPQNRIFL